MEPDVGKKSVLDLALELGVRTDTVLQAMKDIGLPADTEALFDEDEEATLLDQMVQNGTAAETLARGKGIRKLTDEPVITDDILTEALGASENGFSDAHIPGQILFESSFEKKSFLQKMFGKKQDVVNSLRDHPFSEEDIEKMFVSPVEQAEPREASPFKELEEDESPAAMEEPEETVFDEQSADEIDTAEITEADLEDIGGLEEDLLGDLEEFDLEGTEELEDLGVEDLEDIGELSEGEGTSEEGAEEEVTTEDIEELVGEEDLDIDLDEAALEEEGEEDVGEGLDEEEDEEEYVPNFFERMLARIQLTHQEMVVLMLGSIATMLLLLGVTIYWWLYSSPDAIREVWDEATIAYNKGSENLRDPRIPWSKTRQHFVDAANLYAEFIKKFPNDWESIQTAYSNMCDCYFVLAEGDDKAGDKERSEENYRTMAAYYEKYLSLLENIASESIGSNQPQTAFPNVQEQQKAYHRIAKAKQQLELYEDTIRSLEDFVQRFRETDNALDAMIEIGDTYQIWAETKKDEELSLLDKAIKSYEDAIQRIPPEKHEQRMKLYAKMGDVRYRLYEKSLADGKDDEAKQLLGEVIAYYEESEANALQIPLEDMDITNPQEFKRIKSLIQNTVKRLGDLYLIKGRNAGIQWKIFEDTAEPFPDALAQKQQLLAAAKREQQATLEYLDKANQRYDQLLQDSDLLPQDVKEDILYNKAESFYIMRNYPQTIAAGEQLLPKNEDGTKTEVSPDDKIRVKVLYLLGNAAWEEAKTTKDYTKVKDYYYQALKANPFYPAESKGEDSQLADIRLIQSYYMNGPEKQYEEAIKRYEAMIVRYPESAYSYLTRKFYAETLQEYGDHLSDQAKQLREQAQTDTHPASLQSQARKLEQRARQYYIDASDQYLNAINVRSHSKYVDTQNERFLKEIMFNRGHSAFLAGQYQQAEKYYLEALDRYGNDPTAQHFKPLTIERLGDLNVRLTNYDRAIQYYKQYLNSAYENKKLRITEKLADAYLRQFSWEKARDEFQKVVQNDHAVPTIKQAKRKLDLGFPFDQDTPGFRALKKIAESYYSESLHDPEIRSIKMQDALEAYKAFGKHYPLSNETYNDNLPNDKDSLKMIGDINFELGQYENAVQAYDEFLKKQPNYPRKGRILYKMGQAIMNTTLPDKYDRAIEKLGEITPESLDNPSQYADALILLGQAYHKKATYFLEQENDEDLYNQYAQRAQRTYSRVAQTNDPNKIREANIMNAAIESEIRSRQELAVETEG